MQENGYRDVWCETETESISCGTEIKEIINVLNETEHGVVVL